MSIRGLRTLLLAASVALGVAPLHAGAQNLDQSEMAALLVFPVVTGGQPANVMSTVGDVVIDVQRASTLVTVTNGSEANRLLLVDIISGDIGEDAWFSNSYRCYLTGRETTTFVFGPAGPGNSSMHAECGKIEVENGVIVAVETDGQELRQTTGAQNGFMVVSLAQVDGFAPNDDFVIGSNDLFGDAIVVDPLGQAYSIEPLSFQAGPTTNNGDKVYEFGPEYLGLPSVLVSNFVAEGLNNDVIAELILVTLDGRVGSFTTPQVSLMGNVFDDDENSVDWQYQFDCFDIVSLSEISDAFIFDPGAFNLQSPTGHFDMTSVATSAGGDVHDAIFAYGDGDDFRNRGVHGWLVQSVNGVLLEDDQPIAGVSQLATANQAAWARPLLQSTTALVPSGTDRTALDASGN